MLWDYTEQCVRHCTDNEVMSTHAEIRRRIEREIDEHSKSGRSFEPMEEVDIGVEVRCAEGPAAALSDAGQHHSTTY